jgi:hypothetical protein
MPVHDWTRVEAGIFHDFHNAWLVQIRDVCNSGLLPAGYYALTEQHAGAYITDVLTLETPPPAEAPVSRPDRGGMLVAEAAPRARRWLTAAAGLRRRRRTLAIRHVTGHRLIALLEIVSPANKDRAAHVDELVDKVEQALRLGIHVLLGDLLPPGRHDPNGVAWEVWQRLDGEPYELPAGELLTVASYVADKVPDVYLDHLAVGAALPEMPLFLDPDRYVYIPLEPTYQAAYGGVPRFWREVLERRPGRHSGDEPVGGGGSD